LCRDCKEGKIARYILIIIFKISFVSLTNYSVKRK
jgi:hypothetical protein